MPGLLTVAARATASSEKRAEEESRWHLISQGHRVTCSINKGMSVGLWGKGEDGSKVTKFLIEAAKDRPPCFQFLAFSRNQQASKKVFPPNLFFSN